MKKKTAFILKLTAALIALAAVAALCVWLIPGIRSLREPEVQQSFREFIESLGIWGAFAMLLIQILQIVVAIIPGEPIEVLMGIIYGTFGGLFLTLLGIAIGQTLVFFAVKYLGEKFAARFVSVEKFDKLSFLKNPAKRDSLIFLLFFIPGTPKDVLTYFAPLTGINYLRFIIISTLARIPSVITSSFAGATVSEGQLLESLIIFAVTGAVGLLGIYINSRIMAKHNENRNENDKDN